MAERLTNLPKDEESFGEFLNSYNVSIADWGKNEAKELVDLLDELKGGDCYLAEKSDGSLIRVVRVAKIDILAPGLMLIEDRQVFNDGRKRSRNLGTSVCEKIMSSETPEQGADRGLREEVKLTGVEITPKEKFKVEEKRESPSYPNLESVYFFFHFETRIDENQMKSVRLEENDGRKTTYFRWKNV